MFVYNNRSNLFERREFFHPMLDVKEPNLYKALFGTDEPPKVAFNYRTVPVDMPDEIWLNDSTFCEKHADEFSVSEIEYIYSCLHKAGGPKGKIKQTEFYINSENRRNALSRCLEKKYDFPEITARVGLSKKDFALAKNLGVKEVGISVGCSDYVIFNEMGMTRRQAADHYICAVRECINAGLRPRCHFEDITRADLYGFVVPFATELMDVMNETGTPVKIRLCDSFGYGVTFPGTVLPRSVSGLVYGLHHFSNVPHELLEWHGQNNLCRAVTNASSAWLYGCCGVSCSVFANFGKDSIAPTANMIDEYFQLRGTFDGLESKVLENCFN
jgi:isopropylmalate/homocitrate/citramalate synthase